MTPSVLVVDDDSEFRALAGRLLAADGLMVIGEANSVARGTGQAADADAAWRGLGWSWQPAGREPALDG